MAEEGHRCGGCGCGCIHLDSWCACLCYLYFAPENPEDDEQRYDCWVRSSNPECMYGNSRRKRREEYKRMVKDKVEEAEWKYLDVSDHWQQMKNMMETTEH